MHRSHPHLWTDPGRRTWGPSRAVAGLGVVIALGLGVLGAQSDAGGRLLAAIAVAILLGGAGWVLVGGPALSADEGCLRVRGLIRSRAHPWDRVGTIGQDARRRGRAVELEIDGDLVAVPAALLGGASAASVAAELRGIRARALAAPGD